LFGAAKRLGRTAANRADICAWRPFAPKEAIGA
jgi:hypothetical protein